MILVLPDTLIGILLAISLLASTTYFVLLSKNEYKKSKKIQEMTINCDCEIDVNEFAKELQKKLKRSEGVKGAR